MFAARVFIIVCWCAGGHLFAADRPKVVELWPGRVPDEAGNIGAEKVVMSPELDRKQVEVTEPTRMVTNVSRPTITIYRPAKDKETGTAALICPGGGYWNLYWELEGEEVAAWLNSLGITGIILKYRVPRRPDEPKGEPASRRSCISMQRQPTTSVSVRSTIRAPLGRSHVPLGSGTKDSSSRASDRNVRDRKRESW